MHLDASALVCFILGVNSNLLGDALKMLHSTPSMGSPYGASAVSNPQQIVECGIHRKVYCIPGRNYLLIVACLCEKTYLYCVCHIRILNMTCIRQNP